MPPGPAGIDRKEQLALPQIIGTVMRADDLRRFAHTIYENGAGLVAPVDSRLRKVQEAVEKAMQRRLQREITAPDNDAL